MNTGNARDLYHNKINTCLSKIIHNVQCINPNPTGLFEGIESGGGLLPPPPQISAVDRTIATKICTKVETNVFSKTVQLDFSNCMLFILYELNYANLCKNQFNANKSQNKALRLLIFGKNILYNILNNNIEGKIWFRNYFLCILLFFLNFLCISLFFDLLFLLFFSGKFDSNIF